VGLIWLVLIVMGMANIATADRLGTGDPDGIRISEKRLGPFAVKGRKFAVVLRQLHCQGAAEGFEETVESLAIVDMQENIHYQRSFAVEYDRGRFAESVAVQAYILDGGPLRDFSYESGRLEKTPAAAQTAIGLILYYGVTPSAPSSGLACQIFALKGKRLAPLFSPLTVYGRIYGLPVGSTPKTLRLLEGNTLQFGVWTGWFEVIVPIAVMDHLRAVPRYYHSTFDLGAFDVIVHRRLPAEETFVRLFDRPDLNATPRHVIVRPDSQVDFLTADTRVSIERGKAQWAVSVQETPWLQVEIDGRQGFVRDPEDLLALGIQPAG
jgi:hypothetical protein